MVEISDFLGVEINLKKMILTYTRILHENSDLKFLDLVKFS
jgi:hypothetical protein